MHARSFSSVGLEHYLDRVGVAGSNPARNTKLSINVELFYCSSYSVGIEHYLDRAGVAGHDELPLELS